MQPELIIAILSGMITLLASLFVAMYQVRAEFRKLARQLEGKYKTSLFDRRLEAYPLLFNDLNDLNNAIELNNCSKQRIFDIQAKLDKWLSSNALFLSSTTAQIVWRYRSYLIDLIEQYHDKPVPDERWIEIRNIQVIIGKFLRAELGVFDTEPAGTPGLDKPHIKEILDKLGQSSKKTHSRFGY